jgi:dihydroneopterin aldolase
LQGKLERKVFLEEIKLHIKCGVYPEERKLGVEVLVSVEVTSEIFVDYEELYKTVVEVANSQKFTYLEEFQDKLLSNIIDNWNPNFVRIRTLKLSLPFQNSFKGGGVELVWEKKA